MCRSIFLPNLTRLSGLQKRTYFRNNWSKGRGESSVSVYLGLPSGFLFGVKRRSTGKQQRSVLWRQVFCFTDVKWHFFRSEHCCHFNEEHSSKNTLPALSELTCSKTQLIVINCLPKIPIPPPAFSKQLSGLGAQLLTFKKNWKWVCGKRAMRRSLWGNAME